MMNPDNATDLQHAIEGQHGRRVTFVEFSTITERFQAKVGWDGLVGEFDLAGNTIAKRAFADN